MRQHFPWTILLLLSVLCSAPLPVVAQTTPVAPAEATPVFYVATVGQDANLRRGPGTTYARVGVVKSGTVLTIVGMSANGDWLQLDNGNWIAALLVRPVAATPTLALPANVPVQAAAVPLLVGSWNVESGGADPRVVGQRIALLEGVDLWGLSEVGSDRDAAILEAAAEEGEGANFARIVSRSGNRDRLVILYNADRFALLGQDELEYINLGGNVRAPLLVELRDRESAQTVVFMVNHLNRGDAARRHDQAALLNEWAINDQRPTIAVGDYNFDWAVEGGARDHDLGYDYLTAGNEWQWVRPAQLVTTQCSGWPCSYTSVLDFVFVANAAQSWPARAEILMAPDDFPDDATSSDHRPVLAWFQLPAAGATQATPTAVERPVATPTGVAPATLVIIEVNKQDEYAILQNNGSQPVNLSGWILRSERGNQDCALDGLLNAGQTLHVWAQSGQGYSCGFGTTIWSNSDRDPAVLLDSNGREIARYE